MNGILAADGDKNYLPRMDADEHMNWYFVGSDLGQSQDFTVIATLEAMILPAIITGGAARGGSGQTAGLQHPPGLM